MDHFQRSLPASKKCPKCQTSLPIEKFDRNQRTGKPKGECRECCKQRSEASKAGKTHLPHVPYNRDIWINPNASAKFKRSPRRQPRKPRSERKTKTPLVNGRGLNYADRDATLAIWGFNSYGEYLKSQRWASIRARVIELKGDKCLFCPYPATHIHHTRYEPNDLTGKTLEHLHPLCGECHYKVEFDGRNKLSMVESIKKFNRMLDNV